MINWPGKQFSEEKGPMKEFPNNNGIFCCKCFLFPQRQVTLRAKKRAHQKGNSENYIDKRSMANL